MATRFVPFDLDGVPVLVEVVVLPGSEKTAAPLEKAGAAVAGAFDRAQGVITGLGRKVAGSVAELWSEGTHPDEVSVEFALTFAANGNVLIASGSAEGSLSVTITYKGDRPAGPASS